MAQAMITDSQDHLFVADLRDGAYRSSNPIIDTVQAQTHSEVRSFSLLPNFPNPFNPETSIRYEIAESRSVRLVIYDILGREVGVPVNERKAPGIYEARFNASGVASGVYFYRLTAGNFVQTRKMVVLK